jgi:hypothetical protein
MFWLLFLMTVSCLPANRCDWEKKNSDNICYGSYGVTFYPNTSKYTQIHPNTPKYTQIQFQIILFLLFWDVLRIINDSLSALSLFFHEFQQNSQVFTDLVESLTITNIPKYPLKFCLSKVWYIWIIFIFLPKFWYWKQF